MPYQLICSDIDGTLLNKDRELSSKTIAVIREKKERMPVVLISSRMPKAMRHLQEELEIQKHPMIAYNGGLVLTYDQTEAEVLLSIEIELVIAELLLRFTTGSSIHVSLYHADDWYVPAMDYWAEREQNNTKVSPVVADLQAVCRDWKSEGKGPHKIMCMGPAEEIQLLENWLSMYYQEDLHFYRSKPTYLEIASKQISKLSALSFLLDQKYPIKLEEVIAFGDNYNDVDLLEGVGLGVAVANARDAVKAVANKITLSNLEDGVAVALMDL